MALASLAQLFPSFFTTTGPTLPTGLDLQALIKSQYSASSGLTAVAGGGQSLASPINNYLTQVDVVATANDSVTLPPAIPGSEYILNNNTANSMQVFGLGSDQIQASGSTTIQPATTGVAHAAQKAASYFCFKAGIWKQLLSA